MTRSLAILTVILFSFPALAGSGYRSAARALPAYKKAPVKRGPDGKLLTKKMCGWLLYTVKQRRQGRRWSKPIVSMNLNRRVHAQEPCEFPKRSKWKKLERKLRKAPMLKRSGYPYQKGDVIYVMNARWHVRKHRITRRPLSRDMSFQHFSKKFKARLNKCGSLDPKLICEQKDGDNRVPLSFNEIHWRLKNAKKLQGEKKNKECAVRAYRAMTIIKEAVGIANSMRRYGGKKRYRTRFDGTFGAKKAYALFKSQYEAAKALFLACGGTDKDLGYRLRNNPIK